MTARRPTRLQLLWVELQLQSYRPAWVRNSILAVVLILCGVGMIYLMQGARYAANRANGLGPDWNCSYGWGGPICVKRTMPTPGATERKAG